jgi:hypothetical protein
LQANLLAEPFDGVHQVQRDVIAPSRAVHLPFQPRCCPRLSVQLAASLMVWMGWGEVLVSVASDRWRTLPSGGR